MSNLPDDVPGVLLLKRSLVSERVIVVGDPKRSDYVASLLKDVVTVSKVREYNTYTGYYNGQRITVSSHGIGGGGASMCFEELISAGAKVIIRVGTCGSFQPQYREASTIIATSAIRSDGVTDGLVPPSYPAVADHHVTLALEKVCSQIEGLNYGYGTIVTEGKFYDGPLGNQNDLWQRTGILAVEMEASVLFVIGSIRHIKTGCILCVDNYIFQRLEEGGYYPNREVVINGNQRACAIALDAIINVNV